ncbi:MAG: hypothetical protein GY856_13265 [bacterium]|nr:hypothetical protein [bacterium]
MKLHHVGLVVRDLEASLEALRLAHGIEESYGPGVDDRQQAEIVLVRWAGGLWLELLRPTAETSPIASTLGTGGGLHHLCYGVADIGAVAAGVRDRGGILVMAPTPAVAFGGLEVAFAFFRYVGLVEYVDERAVPPFFQPHHPNSTDAGSS